MKKFVIGCGVVVVFGGLWLLSINFMYFPSKIDNVVEKQPAKFYAIQWLSGLTNFQVDAASLAALTRPRNGDMIEVIGFCRPASSDKIFGLPYAATFYELREFELNDTIDLVGRGRKDHHVLAVFRKSQPQPVDPNRRYSIKGVWNYRPDAKSYIEVTEIQ